MGNDPCSISRGIIGRGSFPGQSTPAVRWGLPLSSHRVPRPTYGRRPACPAVPFHAGHPTAYRHCWTSQQWHTRRTGAPLDTKGRGERESACRRDRRAASQRLPRSAHPSSSGVLYSAQAERSRFVAEDDSFLPVKGVGCHAAPRRSDTRPRWSAPWAAATRTQSARSTSARRWNCSWRRSFPPSAPTNG